MDMCGVLEHGVTDPWGGFFPSVTGARLGSLEVEDHSFSLIFCGKGGKVLFSTALYLAHLASRVSP